MSNYSKKHYNELAALLDRHLLDAKECDASGKGHGGIGHNSEVLRVSLLIGSFVKLFQDDNPNFDSDRFHQAIGN